MTTTEPAAAGASASVLGVGMDALSCRTPGCGRRLRGSRIRFCGPCSHQRQVAEAQAKTDEEDAIKW